MTQYQNDRGDKSHERANQKTLRNISKKLCKGGELPDTVWFHGHMEEGSSAMLNVFVIQNKQNNRKRRICTLEERKKKTHREDEQIIEERKPKTQK